MNHLLLLLSIALPAGTSLAQIATAPDGAANISAPPVGERRVSRCGKRACFEVKIQPYCFGTNLRSYSADVQLKPDQDVKIKIKVGGNSGDDVQIKFPASLTYASDGVRRICPSVAGQNLSTPGTKKFTCKMASGTGTQDLIYSVADWRGTKNPACFAAGGSHGPTYCDYAARPLDANLISGNSADSKITCLYTFDSSYQLKPEISCYFPSLMPDESSKVKLAIGGQDTSAADVKAFSNNISAAIPLTSLNWINANSELSNGARVLPKSGTSLPAANVNFFQLEGSGAERALEKDNYELPDKTIVFDQVNHNMSLTIVAKFPGSEGFCGGFYSPLMLFFDKKYPDFNGVSLFPLHGVAKGSRVNWPEAGSTGFFLARLSKDEKVINKATQLFGQDGVSDNGFESLKIHDSDKNGVINSQDQIWKELRLWNDANGNGLSEANEIQTLKAKKIESIDLQYKTTQQKQFGKRARVRESSTFTYESKGKLIQAEVLDVWFTAID
jgi:hypothetical protein